ncbi:MAG TPA: dephospho-CoA kinase [Gammaproteobacteria bacterium]|nr:dephospho-CoA kinase [Gammaproteobacteria bacterium]
MPHRLRIGLTGGIGSGKSEASRHFASLGATVIDTDIIARELVEPGQPALAKIVETFGDDMLDADGHLDRARLRDRVFADSAQRAQLEAILHPSIRARAIALSEQAAGPYCVLVIPLLAETGADYPLDRVLVIDTPVSLQRERIAARDGLSAADIEAVLASQASRAQRLAIADDIIVNDAGRARLRSEIERLHDRYSALAHSHKA